jgi:hypothetical protein
MSSWRTHLPNVLIAVLGAVVGVVLTIVAQELSGSDPTPRPPALGTIDAPHRDDVVAVGSAASGRLRDIPDDQHVWLVARRGDRQWPSAQELPRDPSWQASIPRSAPPGKPVSLFLVVVGGRGNEQLNTAAGHELGIADIRDAKPLASVPKFYVKVKREPDPLNSVFIQTKQAGGNDFRFLSKTARLDADFPDDPDCHRPERAVGLRLRWDMSRDESGGWGVAWDHRNSPSGDFNASEFKRLSFWVKGGEGGEIFEIGLKDTAKTEKKVQSEQVGSVAADRWMELVVPLADFKGVDKTSIENVNFGFNQQHGSGTVCIDEIAFE